VKIIVVGFIFIRGCFHSLLDLKALFYCVSVWSYCWNL